jgi:prepilin-type N-terminal cleavage/methylation domain-containing protein
MFFEARKKAFSLIELLVVIAIIALMLAILSPALSRARRQAKVLQANSELRQIGICLDMYAFDNEGKSPPTRTDCNLLWQDHQLPPELVEGGYLPAPSEGSFLSTGIEDVFNSGNTYRYHSVGQLYQNGRYSRVKASVYVPANFPSRDEGSPETDILYNDPAKSPVSWVIYSGGPDFDYWEQIVLKKGPVARRSWYDAGENKGLIVRMKLRNGDHIGSFEGD